MNTPNKLTIARFIMSPVFLILLVCPFPHHLAVALAVFIVASVTDLLDGHIARSRGIVTDFGKFLDPIADKMLTTAAFLGFIAAGFGWGIVYITFIVLLREFTVTSVRLLAAKDGTVIAANKWGKAKTVSQIVAIIMALTFEYGIWLFVDELSLIGSGIATPLRAVYSAALWISAVLTVISGITYLKDNAKYLNPKNQ